MPTARLSPISRPASRTKLCPPSSVTRPSLNLPTRIFGPCRSQRIATVRPVLVASSFTRAARFSWSAAVPCEKLSRTTSTPARIILSRIAGSEEAGPSVATIFVLRSIVTSLSDVQHELPLAAAAPVLPEIDALPCAERKAPVDDRNADRRLCQRRLDVRRHVVRALGVVLIERIAFRHESIQPSLEVRLRRRVG